jgi:hypothetical protein
LTATEKGLATALPTGKEPVTQLPMEIEMALSME